MPISILPHAVPARISGPVARAAARTGVTPNTITLAGFLGNAAAAVLAATDYWLAAGVVMLVASALDLLDGALARATGKVTRFGAIFDAVLDRYSEVAVLLGLAITFERRGGNLELGLIVAAMIGSVMVSYIRARAETANVRLREGLFTRAERVVLTALALIVGHWWEPAVTWALGILAVFATLTTIQRIVLLIQKEREA